jgi:hypothetical protein
MSTIRKGLTSFVASQTIASFLRVKYTSGNQIAVAGATDKEVGVTTGDKTSNAVNTPAPVQLLNEPGTVFCTANGAINDGDTVYRAAGGKVSDGGAEQFGIALEAASADGDVIEVLPLAQTQKGEKRFYVATGHNGAGNVTVTGALNGDVIDQVVNITSGGDVTSGFTSPLTVDNTVAQTSGTDLSAAKLLFIVHTP